ncbi:MAG: ParA family protein [Patescibacteria group bacterium]|jgi:chromosome partitioning protein
MAKIITIANQKGGVGKTTTAHALATGLKLLHKKLRILTIDLDAQGSLSFAYGAETEKAPTIYDALKNQMETKDSKIKEIIQKLPQGDIIPGDLRLSGADLEFNKTGREYLLKETLETITNDYDYIIIDTPPSLGILTVMAFTASNEVLIPIGADILSYRGLGQLNESMSSVIKYSNKELKISGILITQHNAKTNLGKGMEEKIQRAAAMLDTKLFKTHIKNITAVKEAQFNQKSLFEYSPTSIATNNYRDFIQEYLKG